MWAARATGMKVRRYFVGFGPTLWSTRRGETEYGVKAIPAGGFCDIAGMTVGRGAGTRRAGPSDVQAGGLETRRGAVRRAGHELRHLPGAHLCHRTDLGAAEPAPGHKAAIGETVCVAADTAQGKPGKCEGQGPAEAAGIRKGDVVVKVGDTPVSNFDDMAAAVRQSHGIVPIVVQRDGKAITYHVNVQSTQRWMSTGQGSKPQLSTVGAIGVGPGQIGPTHYSVLSAVPGTLAFTADLTGEVGKSLVENSDQGRRAGARHWRWTTRPGHADERRRSQHHRR